MTGREAHKAFQSETNKAKTSELKYSSSENWICTYYRKDNSALYMLYIYIAQLTGQFVDRKNCGRFVKELGLMIDWDKIFGRFMEGLW